MKNFIFALLISLGTPMLLMGDEMRRTQRGNNNAYCQDNEVSWLDWRLLDRHADLHRFVRTLISHRLRGTAMRSDVELRAEAEPQRGAAPRRDRLARRPAQPAGLVRQLAQYCLHRSAQCASLSVLDAPDVHGSRCGSASAGDAISRDAALRGGAARAHRRPLWAAARGRGQSIVTSSMDSSRPYAGCSRPLI